MYYIILAILYPILMEYVAHRWLMHKNVKGFYGFYKRHTLLHHKKKAEHINIDMQMEWSCILGMPSTILAFFACPYAAILFLILTIFYGYFWTKLHRSFHCIEHNWVEKMWFYEGMKNHHLVHHLKPNKNYGTIFTFSDYFFGTKF